MNPIIVIVMLVMLVMYGLDFFVYVGVSFLLSSAIGWYAERKILAYDCAIRRRAEKATGRKMPGGAGDLARLVKNACKISGPFTAMAVPGCILLVSWYLSWQTGRILDGRAFQPKNAVSTAQAFKRIRNRQALGYPAPGTFRY